MLIQEFCRITGLGRDTVRFYVRKGLLVPTIGAPSRGSAERGRPTNRYQVFDAGQVERARLIRAAQQLGFTLREIAALAADYERKGLTRARKAEILRAHLSRLEVRAARLEAVRGYLAAKLAWLEGGQLGEAPRLALGVEPRAASPRATRRPRASPGTRVRPS